jgi:hypothetical protein
MNLKEAQQEIRKKLSIGAHREPKLTWRELGVYLFELLVIVSTFGMTLELLSGLGAPWEISAIGATAAFIGAWKLIEPN